MTEGFSQSSGVLCFVEEAFLFRKGSKWVKAKVIAECIIIAQGYPGPRPDIRLTQILGQTRRCRDCGSLGFPKRFRIVVLLVSTKTGQPSPARGRGQNPGRLLLSGVEWRNIDVKGTSI